jgi:hypothetical protein
MMATKSYLLRGWHKNKPIKLIVDAEEVARAFSMAKTLYPDIVLATSESRFKEPVPEAAKNILFASDEELWAAVPELKPRRRRARR